MPTFINVYTYIHAFKHAYVHISIGLHGYMHACIHSYIYRHSCLHVHMAHTSAPSQTSYSHSYHSSVVSKSSVSLYMRPLALRWLPVFNIALVWLPLALRWLPTTRFFISRAPNMVTRLEVELQPLHWLPTRAPCIRFYLKSIHKGILTETPIHIPNFICYQEIIST